MEALPALAVKPDGRLRIGVPVAAFAGLVSLDPGRVKHIDVPGDAGVQRAEPRLS